MNEEYEKWLEEHQSNEQSQWTDHSTYWEVIVLPIAIAMGAIIIGSSIVLGLDYLFRL